MFQLHDKTRRRICVALFMGLCVFPTVVIGAWCVSRQLPVYTAAEALRLETQLGLDVNLAEFSHPTPGVALYRGLELVDPESGRTVARCRMLEATWGETSDSQGNPQPVLILTASQPEIEGESFDQLSRLVDRLLRGNTTAADVSIRFSAAEVTFRADADSQTLTEVTGGLEPSPGGTEAEVTFRLAGVEMPEPARIRVVRNRQSWPPQTGFELFTGAAEIPCGTLAIGLPLLEPLGSRSRFRGYVWATLSDGGWEGQVTGQLLDVPLGNIISERFPHKLSGEANIDIQSAKFAAGRLQKATGKLSAGPGIISRSLIEAAVERLNLTAGVDTRTLRDLVSYEKLSVAFEIDASGLRLAGNCQPPGTILVDQYRPLLGNPTTGPQPVVALLQTLVPANEVQVPATDVTDWLMRRLPVPAIELPEGATAPPPTARLRLGGTEKR
jgi:hypothetical protein